MARSCVIGTLPANHRAAMVTVSGGVGVPMADDAERRGLAVPPTPEAAQQRMLELDPFAAARNPIDVTDQFLNDPSLLDQAIELAATNRDYGSLVSLQGSIGQNPALVEVTRAFWTERKRANPDKHFAVSGFCIPGYTRDLEAVGIPVNEEATRAIAVLAVFARLFQERRPRQAGPAPESFPTGPVNEPAALDILAAAGVPTVPALHGRTAREAADAAAELGFPVVLKVLSADILHKSDIGGVRLGVPDRAAAATAFDEIIAAARAAEPDGTTFHYLDIRHTSVHERQTGECVCTARTIVLKVDMSADNVDHVHEEYCPMTWSGTMTERNDHLEADNGRFTVRLAGSDFQFSEVAFFERKPEAGAMLRQLGKTPTLDHRLVRLTYPGTTSYDDDERVDLKAPTPPDFLICEADRLMACAIDEVAYDLPVTRIQGKHLRLIARIPDQQALFLERTDEHDLEIGLDDWVDLGGKGVERLYSRDSKVTVCLDKAGNEFELPRGRYTMVQLIAAFGLSAGQVLNYVDRDGKLTPFKDDKAIQIFEDMKFFAHAASGGSS